MDYTARKLPNFLPNASGNAPDHTSLHMLAPAVSSVFNANHLQYRLCREQTEDIY